MLTEYDLSQPDLQDVTLYCVILNDKEHERGYT